MSNKLKIITLFIAISLAGCGGDDTKTEKKSTQLDETLGKEIPTTQTPITITPDQEHNRSFLIPKEHLSLSVGTKEKLTVADNKEVTWSSNNPAVSVDNKGYIYAKEDKRGADAKAIITATFRDGTTARCNITIVDWRANLSTLTIVSNPRDGELIGKKDDGTLLISAGPNLYASTDGWKNSNRVGDFPSSSEQTPILLKTPYSYYLRSDARIFDSQDMVNYSEILTQTTQGKATDHPGLNHAFAYDPIDDYIYAGEYTVGEGSNGHSVWRGKAGYGGISGWKKVLEFDSLADATTNTVKHIHATVVDPYTGNVWVGTGDSDAHSILYYSDDNGESFKLFAIGSQKYRILAMWFTKDYIYWNTDSDYEDQLISRVKRSDHKNRGELTPRLEAGETKKGVKYYVYKNGGNLPVGDGRVYTEEQNRDLQGSVVYAVNDPEYDYRQTVATLANGSHWYYGWYKDSKGEELVIMSAAAEGEKRDKRARLFGIKELKDGSVDVQELLSIGTPFNDELSHYVQLTPGYQDDEGYIYFRGRKTEHMIYKMRLEWKDQINRLVQ